MKAMRINVLYQGELSCDVHHTVSTGKLHTDLPKDQGGHGESFSPADLYASGLACSLMTALARTSRQRKLDIIGAKAQVDYALGDQRFEQFVVRITVPKRIAEAERLALEAGARQSPCLQSLRPDIDVDVSFNYVGA